MVVHIHIFLQKLRRTLKNERGEANYFSTVVFIFIAVILLAFIIDLFSIISTKQELDHAADQMVKQLGTPFYITIEGDAKLGGFWNLDLVNITVVARGSGVSEHYWK